MNSPLKPLRPVGPGCLSDWALDALLADDTSGAEAESAKRHLSTCLPCRGRFEQLSRERAQFQGEPPAAAHRPAASRRIAWRAGAGGLALAASFAIVIWARGPVSGSLERSKGAEAPVKAFLVRQGRSSAVASGAKVRPGDELQLVYSSEVTIHGALLGMDGGGKARVYFPEAGTSTAKLEAGDAVSWPVALQLDSQPGSETFLALLCEEAMPLEPVRNELERSRERLQAPKGCRAALFTFAKGAE